MARRNKPFYVKLSHYPKEESWRITTVATPWYCKRCYTTSNAGTQYYIDVGNLGATSASWCTSCHHRFHAAAQYNKPYWVKHPTQASTSNIRTNDDAGWREYEDGIWQEWLELWEGDLKRET